MQDALFGRLAVHHKMITVEQLAEAVAEQGRSQQPQQLGQILVDKGHLTDVQVVRLLELQRALLKKQAALQAAQATKAPPAAPAAPQPRAPPQPRSTSTPPSTSPVAGPPEPPPPAAEPRAAPSISPAPFPVAPPQPTPAPPKPAAATPPAPAPAPLDAPSALARLSSSGPAGASGWLRQFIETAVKGGASDIHIHSGAKLRVRYLGQLFEMGEHPVSSDDAERRLLELLTERDRKELEDKGEVDFACTLEGLGRFRANMYRQQHGVDCVLRAIPAEPPTLTSLGLPTSLARLTTYHQGIVLVTGPAGSGKTSTLSALVNIINEDRSDHILTVEDPIEVIHPSKRCIVNQRQVKRHTGSFARALKGALREDPDVIVIGEMRDHETISLALTAAETGHLVLSTLHTGSAIRTINRLVGVFPPNQQPQIRAMISESLRAVVSQRLVPRADGQGRAAALEVLYVTSAVGNLIRENRALQIRSVLQTGVAQGQRALDQSLLELVQQGVITAEAARRVAEDPKRFSQSPAPAPQPVG